MNGDDRKHTFEFFLKLDYFLTLFVLTFYVCKSLNAYIWLWLIIAENSGNHK